MEIIASVAFIHIYKTDNGGFLNNILLVFSTAIALAALLYSISSSNKTIRLSVQQTIFKFIQDKARDCETVWNNEPDNEMSDPDSPHFLVVSEMIIAITAIEKAIELYSKNYDKLRKDKQDYYYIYWQSLHIDIKGWFENTTSIADGYDQVYKNQIRNLYLVFGNYIGK